MPDQMMKELELLTCQRNISLSSHTPGFASDGNFEEHYTELKAALDKDGMVIKGPPIKATYNSPFTLPFLRRNEAMLH